MPKCKDIVLLIDCNDLLWVKEENLPEISIRNNMAYWTKIKSNPIGGPEIFLKIAWINIEKITELIEYACLFFGGVWFITSESLDEYITKNAILKCLELSKRAEEKIRFSPFFSLTTIAPYFPEDNPAEIPKSLWLEKYFQRNIDVSNTRLVVLNASIWEVHILRESQYVLSAIHATTRFEDSYNLLFPDWFYTEAQEAMEYALPKQCSLFDFFGSFFKKATQKKVYTPIPGSINKDIESKEEKSVEGSSCIYSTTPKFERGFSA